VAPVSLIRASLLFIGFVLLLLGAWDKLVPRPHYESSSPAPGSVLDKVPQLVTVKLSEELDQSSTILVHSTITLKSNGEQIVGEGKQLRSQGPSLENAKALQITMPADAARGLYWVQWQAVAAQGKATRYGLFYFAVGMPPPEYIAKEPPGALSERNPAERRYRAVLLGGVLMVGFGLLFPHVSRRR